MFSHGDTIVAPATATGGALSLIRISGPDALRICDRIFVSPTRRKLSEQRGRTLHYGSIVKLDGSFIDEVLVSVFRAPASYTGEEMAEISCHGSRWITAEIIRLLTEAGARAAEAGEFTVRAFLAGKLDLSQAEAVADMIASNNKASHALATNQLRGTYSNELSTLRSEILRLAALLELELDFSEEDVTFADRTQLDNLLARTIDEIDRLSDSFALGNAIKEGIGVAIIGNPNVGKSTLLNKLLGDDRAMVSDIAGTTRDVIEEVVNISGIGFRFIDTAGIRESADVLEQMGIERTYKALSKAQIVLYLIDGSKEITDQTLGQITDIKLSDAQQSFILINKCDDTECETIPDELKTLNRPVICISAKYGYNIETLKALLASSVDTTHLFSGEAIVSNARHYEALRNTSRQLTSAREGLNSGLPAELLAEEIREVLDHIGTITGEVTTDEILGEIFSKFCIGK